MELYHVAGPSWQQGDNLLSRDEVVNNGGDPGAFLWDDEADYTDGDIISFVRTLDEARAWRDEWRPGATILRVTVRDSRVIVNAEGYPSVAGYVSAENIEIVGG